MKRYPLTQAVLVCAVAAAASCGPVQKSEADTLVFGTFSSEPVNAQASGVAGEEYSEIEDTESFNSEIGVPQFRPEWGTLNSVHVDANAYLTAHWVSIHTVVEPGTEVWVGAEAEVSIGTAGADYADDYSAIEDITYGPFSAGPSNGTATSTTGYTGDGIATFTVYHMTSVILEDTEYNYAQVAASAAGIGLVNVTYDFDPGTPSGDHPQAAAGSGGDSQILGSQPTGGWGLITVGSNGQVSPGSGNNVIATGVENYGILSQSGGNVTVSGTFDQQLNFYSDSNGSLKGVYNLSGGTASFGAITGNGIITQSGGSLMASSFTQTGTISFDANGNQTLGGVYNLSSGTSSLGAFTNNGIVNQSGGTLTATSYVSTDSTYTNSNNTIQHFGVFNLTDGNASLGDISGSGSIVIGPSGRLTASSYAASTGSLTVNGYMQITSTTATRGTSAVAIDAGSLSLGSSGLLDITNHDLIIRGGLTLSEVGDLISEGSDGGAWDGTAGITSSTALADGATLDYDTAGDLGLSTFDGISVDPGDILVSYDSGSLGHAFIAAVPEPQSLATASLGCLVLLRRKTKMLRML